MNVDATVKTIEPSDCPCATYLKSTTSNVQEPTVKREEEEGVRIEKEEEDEEAGLAGSPCIYTQVEG